MVIVLVVFLGMWNALSHYGPVLLERLAKQQPLVSSQKTHVITEESVVINTVKKVGPSVVTVAAQLPEQSSLFEDSPFSYFGPEGSSDQPEGPQGIGSGFIVSSEGLVVTNKHVVSDSETDYKIVTVDDKVFDVQKIYRDPLNDIAILKIDPKENSNVRLKPLELGDSSQLQVGQFVIAIGTALGEFKNTVTTGVVSGLGRGIVAGGHFSGAEKLDNVIQTDAAINPGNSGGPLLNSSSQVIGVNTAIAQDGQNIGFAIPSNAIRDSLDNFNQTGQFNRPYLGVGYRIISRDLSVVNNIAEGAYVQRVVENSPADKAGIKRGDIITRIDEQKLTQDNDLAKIISKKKVGDSIKIMLWREDKTENVTVTLEPVPDL